MINKALIAVNDDLDGWAVYGISSPCVTNETKCYSHGLIEGDINIHHYGLSPLYGHDRVNYFSDIGGKQAYTALQQAINNDILYGVYPHNPYITKVIFNGPATIVFFKDGSKEVVKCKNMSWRYNPEIGILYAVLKHTCDKKTYDNNLRVIDEMIGGSDDE